MDSKKDSHPDLLKYMLYYDLMVKLAVTDTATLFNLTATIQRLDQEQEMKMKIVSKNPKLDSAKNLNDTLVDAYLLHFLGEMDPKMASKSDLYKKMLAQGKPNSKQLDVEDMGKLQSMRELMKQKAVINSDKSEEKLNLLLGNLVKRKILQRKAGKIDVQKLGEENNEGIV